MLCFFFQISIILINPLSSGYQYFLLGAIMVKLLHCNSFDLFWAIAAFLECYVWTTFMIAFNFWYFRDSGHVGPHVTPPPPPPLLPYPPPSSPSPYPPSYLLYPLPSAPDPPAPCTCTCHVRWHEGRSGGWSQVVLTTNPAAPHPREIVDTVNNKQQG